MQQKTKNYCFFLYSCDWLSIGGCGKLKYAYVMLGNVIPQGSNNGTKKSPTCSDEGFFAIGMFKGHDLTANQCCQIQRFPYVPPYLFF